MIDPIVQWFLGLFTPEQQAAGVWILAVTLAGTHIGKIIWRALPYRGGGTKTSVLLAAIVGVLASLALWPAGNVPWWAAGIVAGPLSNIAFAIAFGVLKRLAPDAAATVNFDRRRDRNPIPPMHVQDRRE